MNKLSFMKTRQAKALESVRYVTNIKPAGFVDRYSDREQKGLPVQFKHSWAMIAHMNDLRMWTLAYAPTQKNGLQRMQEMHRLNNEAIYLVQDALWKRIIVGVFLWFLVNKIAKKRFLNNGAKDSHDGSFRDTTATL